MSSESLHAPRERLSKKALEMHHAIISLMEELDAIDWYRQRSDDAEDEALRGILLHNMHEEMEHASMLLEWLRRFDADFDHHLRTYLFTEAPILKIEDIVTADGALGAAGGGAKAKPPRRDGGRGFTVGSLKED